MTATFNECKNSDFIIVIGANPTENHPVAATFFKQAAKRGAKLVVMDPRGQALKRHAWQMMQFKNGTDVAMLNAMLNVIVTEKLYDQQYVQTYVEGFAPFAESIKDFTPEEMAPICGIPADTLREVARSYARAESAIIFWGMGVSQHTHGTDNARCLIALALVDRPGRPSRHRPASAARPEQRAGRLRRRPDPDVLPRLQRSRTRSRSGQSTKRPGQEARSEEGQDRGRDHARVHTDEIKGMYIMGENPAMSDPDLNHARGALAHLEHLVVQDIFLTETAPTPTSSCRPPRCAEKDGTVTNTNRQVQMGRPALPLPGDTRQDLWIVQDLAQRMGEKWNYQHVSEVFEEMARLMPALDNITWERVEREDHVTYPTDAPDKPGHDVVFDKGFPRPGGFGKLVAAKLQPPNETPDHDYPFILTTGRQLRALAHRRHDAARLGARRAGAVRGRVGVARHAACTRPQAGRQVARHHAPRRSRTRLAPGRRHPRRRGVHPVRLRRGGGQYIDQPGARSLRQDPGIQVLRGEGGGRGAAAGGGVGWLNHPRRAIVPPCPRRICPARMPARYFPVSA